MRYALLIYCDEETAVADVKGSVARNSSPRSSTDCGQHRVPAGTQRLLSSRAAGIVWCWDGGDITITGRPAAQTREHLTG